MRDAVVLAVTPGPGHRVAAEGGIVQGRGTNADLAGPTQIHAIAGFQAAGEADK